MWRSYNWLWRMFIRLVQAFLKQKDIFLMVFEFDKGGSECIQCPWPSYWDGDASKFFEFVLVFGF